MLTRQRDYFKKNEDEHTLLCVPYRDDSNNFMILLNGNVHSLFFNGKSVYSPSAADVKQFAQTVNTYYDSYNGWDDVHIATEVMTECGCSDCPFFEDCAAMDDFIH